MKDPVPVCLGHLGVNVKTGVAQLCDFLSQQFHPVYRVTEDDALVDLKLGEECVETVNFLSLFYKGIVLSDSFQSELVHEIDQVRFFHVSLLQYRYSESTNTLCWSTGAQEHH